MAEIDDTRKGFPPHVEPPLEAMARYAARLVGPADRDLVVEEALIRTRPPRGADDGAPALDTARLLGVVDEVCRSSRARRPRAPVVELVDGSVALPPSPDPGLEAALDSLGGQERQVVDLRHFVGLDVPVVAQVLHVEPTEVTAALRRAAASLSRLTGEVDPESMDRRLRIVARRWQADQPPPPDLPVARRGRPLGPGRDRRTVLAVGVVVLAVGAGVAIAVRTGSDRSPPVPGPTPTAAVPHPTRGDQVVPWRDLEPGHPAFTHDANGVPITPYDQVSVTGRVAGTVHPGDTLVFDAALTSPGNLSLRPCPDYTITFGTHSVTRRLNCAQVPYYASFVRPDGRVTAFRPVLPAGTVVFFRMAVIVPDGQGPQQVLWSLDGPARRPGFSGTVRVE